MVAVFAEPPAIPRGTVVRQPVEQRKGVLSFLMDNYRTRMRLIKYIACRRRGLL